MCRFWRSGCRNGKLCPFAHGEQELMGRPDLCKTSLCQRWAKGACPLDATECRFAHGRLDLRATPNFMHGIKDEAAEEAERQEAERLCVEAERAQFEQGLRLNAGGNSSGNPHGSQGGGASQPAPQFWEEQEFSDGLPYMNGGSQAPWGNRSHGNHGNPGGEALLDQMQAVLAQREWQWSPEYGDSLQDGDTHPNRRNRRAHNGRPQKNGVTGPLDAGPPGPIAATGTANNGRPQQQQQMPQQQMPQQLLHLLNGGQNGLQSLPEPQQNWSPACASGWPDSMQASAATTNGRPQQMPQPNGGQQMLQQNGGLQMLQLLQQNGGQNGSHNFQHQNWPDGGVGWSDGMQACDPLANMVLEAKMSYTGTPDRGGYAPQLEVSEFPHAITAPDMNGMHSSSTIPQEVRAIWS